jgi:aspartate/methionine/tyrosine aminotransferase
MTFGYLQKTSAWSALSEMGKRIFLPAGIMVWAARAKEEMEKDPNTINATVGTAIEDDGSVMHLRNAELYIGHTLDAKAKIFGYAPVPGLPTLRNKWRDNIIKLAPEHERQILTPTVTSGITHGLSIVAKLFLKPGETVIYPAKSWGNYNQIFGAVHGAKIKNFEQFKSEKLNIEAMIQACEDVAQEQKKVILVLNFPHNQTGFTPTQEEFAKAGEALQELCKRHPVTPFVFVLDDAYESFVYDGKGYNRSPVHEMFTRLPNLTLVKLDGASKKYLMYGSRIGFITIFLNNQNAEVFSSEEHEELDKEWTSKVSGIIRGEISQVNHQGQVMLDSILKDTEKTASEQARIFNTLKNRWKALSRAFTDQIAQYGDSKLRPDPCNSGFFCFVNLNHELSPTAFVEQLIEKERIVVFPAEKDKGLRIAFCSISEAQIGEVIEKMYRVAHA